MSIGDFTHREPSGKEQRTSNLVAIGSALQVVLVIPIESRYFPRYYQQTKRRATDAQPPHRFAFLCVLFFAFCLRTVPRYACDFERSDV